jgi:Glyoxalase-like domain
MPSCWTDGTDTMLHTQVDHLVVVADTLAQGARWCEATLGVAPNPGGKHALMGTHNRLLHIASLTYPHTYLEIIAIDTDAPSPTHARWFGMDDPALQAAVKREPQLVHFVARTNDVAQACAALAQQKLDVGMAKQASRETPNGTLSWQITVRSDGVPQADGALPTLIQWGDVHPTDAMPASTISLRHVITSAAPHRALKHAYEALNLLDVAVADASSASLQAVLQTPRGFVTLQRPNLT